MVLVKKSLDSITMFTRSDRFSLDDWVRNIRPVVCMAWEGRDAISVARKLIGSTNGREVEPGTIRGDFGMDMGFNMIRFRCS